MAAIAAAVRTGVKTCPRASRFEGLRARAASHRRSSEWFSNAAADDRGLTNDTLARGLGNLCQPARWFSISMVCCRGRGGSAARTLGLKRVQEVLAGCVDGGRRLESMIAGRRDRGLGSQLATFADPVVEFAGACQGADSTGAGGHANAYLEHGTAPTPATTSAGH
jgi:hypothetical protein